MTKLRCALAISSLVAAAGSVGAPIDEGEYSGLYMYNFETSVLQPDGQSEEWCVDPRVMSKAIIARKDRMGPRGTAHVVVRGKLGPVGTLNPFGRCTRQLDVSSLLEVTDRRRSP